jgi:hypothetical protein
MLPGCRIPAPSARSLTVISRRATLLVPLAALAAGCLYDFKNPAESLRTGEASGVVVADRAGAGTLEGFPGVAVTLKGSRFDVTTHETGRFTIFGLPVGRHTLLFRRGATWALEREVEVAFGKDGQPEGVELGQVVLRYSAAVEGTFALPFGYTFASGVALDEATGLTAMMTGDPFPNAGRGRFRFTALGVGDHRVKLVATGTLDADPSFPKTAFTFVGGPAVVAVAPADQGTTKTLALVAARGAAGTGTLRFRVQVVGLALPLSQVTVTLSPDPLGLNPLVPASDGSVQVDVPEGIYQVTVAVPPSAPTGAAVGAAGPVSRVAAVITTPLPPPAAQAVVLASEAAAIGTVYAVGLSAVSEAGLACRTEADCGRTPCLLGLCTDYSPPFSVGAGTSFCAPCVFSGAFTAPCDAAPGVKGACLCPDPDPLSVTCQQSTGAAVASVCVPPCAAGLFCTNDGVQSACN